MQRKKKLITFLVTIMFFILSTPAYADDSSYLRAEMSGDKSEDGEITVEIYGDDISNLGSAEIELSYDNSKLQFIGGKTSDKYSTMAESVEDLDSKVKVAVIYEDAVDGKVSFAEIKFKVLAGSGEKVSMNLEGIFVDIDTYESMDIEEVDVIFTVDGISNLILYGAIGLVIIVILVGIFIFVKKRKVVSYYKRV